MPNMTEEDLIKQLKESRQRGINSDPGIELKLPPPSKYPPVPMPQMEMGGKKFIDLEDGRKIPSTRRPAKIRENGFIELKKGGKVSASSRADGCVTKGKTKGRFV
jgi:hypothetical protein